MNKKLIMPIIIGMLLAIFYFIVIILLVFINIPSWLKIVLIIMDTLLVGLMIQMLVEKVLEIMGGDNSDFS